MPMPALAELPSPTVEDAMRPRLRRVLRTRRETYDTVTLEIDAHGEPGFLPGQFNMLSLPGVGEVAISISGDGESPGPLVHTIRAVAAATTAITASKRGSLIGVRGPFGSAWPVDAARGKDVVVVAGGIGLAPLRPAVLHLLRHREDYGRVAVLYGARTPADLLYVHQIETWRRRLDVDVAVSVDAAPATWRGNVGVVTTLLPRVAFDPSDTVAMVCGPEVMMRFAAAALAERGVASGSIWLSLERNMKCGVGLCGHCQLGPILVCRDGPVMRHDQVAALMAVREL